MFHVYLPRMPTLVLVLDYTIDTYEMFLKANHLLKINTENDICRDNSLRERDTMNCLYSS